MPGVGKVLLLGAEVGLEFATSEGWKGGSERQVKNENSGELGGQGEHSSISSRIKRGFPVGMLWEYVEALGRSDISTMDLLSSIYSLARPMAYLHLISQQLKPNGAFPIPSPQTP